LLLLIAAVYTRGWLHGRRIVHHHADSARLWAFIGGLALVFVAGESPLDTFDKFFLSAHMAQHFLLMMVAPPLILLGHPFLPLLRGLPKGLVKEGLGPFLTWKALKRVGWFLTNPAFTLFAFAASTILWHLPFFYELALRSSAWHELQHACFFWTGILFWWPVIQPGPGRVRWPEWGAIPYLLISDLINTAISAAFVYSGRLLYPSYAVTRTSGLSAIDDQILAGLIMWVPGSLIYLVPAFAIAMRVLTSPKLRHDRRGVRVERQQTRQPVLGLSTLVKWRRPLQGLMLLVAIAVMADGFFGPQLAPVNLAGVLPWIHWRALAVLALLLAGNLFCMACPFTLVRDAGRKVFSPTRRWPRVLRNKWIPALLILVYLWSYEAFGIWNSPWFTAWVVAGYFIAAFVVDTVFRGASFCKYVCPIGQFHFLTSIVSPREVAVKSAATCRSCTSYDCIRGNSQARGCELYLFQPKKAGNLDCTFCLDCVKACPHDNVALTAITPAKTLIADPYRSSIGRLSQRTDIAALALLVVFGAFVNAAGMVDPVMMWEHGLHGHLWPGAMPFITAAFVLTGCVILPVAAIVLCASLSQTPSAVKKPDLIRRAILALVPVGVGMWTAHLMFHLTTGWNSFLAPLSRAFTGLAGSVAAASPSWLTPLQILVLNAGLLLTLFIGWRIAQQLTAKTRQAVALALPWGALAFVLYSVGLWILFQPMQMRGMLH
jgi:cytochrome c oxidase assembly factor CtaG/ferredoxin